MATHSSILAWRIPWTEEPGGLWGCKESDTTEWLMLSLSSEADAVDLLLCRENYFKNKSESESHSVVSDSFRPMDWNSPGQNTGMGSLSLLQVIFPTQGSKPGLLHCRRILYQLSHKGSPQKQKAISNWSFIMFCLTSNSISCSVIQLCLTFCDPMDCSMPGFPVLHHLPGFAQTHVHWVNDAERLELDSMWTLKMLTTQ